MVTVLSILTKEITFNMSLVKCFIFKYVITLNDNGKSKKKKKKKKGSRMKCRKEKYFFMNLLIFLR